jgi:hypothetical protein
MCEGMHRAAPLKGVTLDTGAFNPLAADEAVGVWRPTRAARGPSIDAQFGARGLAGDEPRFLNLSTGPPGFPDAPRQGEKLEVEEAEGTPPVDVPSIQLACRVEEALLIMGFGFW